MLPGKKYSIADYAAIAWRRRWVIVIPMILCGYGALIASSRLKDVYQSEMLIQIVPQRVPDAYVRSTVTIKTEDRLDALSQQVKSRTELERLIEQMNLYADDRQRLPMEDIVSHMRDEIVVDVVRSQREDPDAFFVRFSYPDAELATRVTERIGALFIDFNARDRGALAQSTNDFLQTQLGEARRRLEEQEQKLEVFRERNAGRLPTQLEFNMQAISSTQLQLQALVESLARDRDRKLMLERLYADAQAEPPPAPAVAPNASVARPDVPIDATPQQQLEAAKESLKRLEMRLTQEHPDVVRTRRIVGELEKRVAELKSAEPGTVAAAPPPTREEAIRRERQGQMRAEIESLARQIGFKEAEEQRLRRSVAEYQSRMEQVPGVESEWIAISRDYETQQNAYRDLLRKSEESSVAADLEKRQIGEQFRVLDPARRPIRPTGISRLVVNAAGVAVGLVLGLLISVLLEIRDTSFRTETDVTDVLQLPVIALVPYVTTDADRRRYRRQRKLVSGLAAASVVVGGYTFWALELWKHIR